MPATNPTHVFTHYWQRGTRRTWFGRDAAGSFRAGAELTRDGGETWTLSGAAGGFATLDEARAWAAKHDAQVRGESAARVASTQVAA